MQDGEEEEKQEQEVVPAAMTEEDAEDWSVVERVESAANLAANDEVLARAAELIGSALFSSQDMDGVKIEATPEQLQRYAAQLTPLIELGFVDRFGMKAVVDVLESLTAANLGSGEMKEVAADRVIQVLEKNEAEGEPKGEE